MNDKDRTGPGTKPGRPFRSPEQVAEALERLRLGRLKGVEHRKALRAVAVDQLDLHDLSKRVIRRHYEVALMWLGGYSYETIAQAMGYGHRTVIMQILKRPDVARLIDLVRQAQLERIIRGEFGVRAQAKAAAPRAMATAIDLAGAGGQGKRAAKDSDALKAVDTVLTVSGDKVERKEVHTTHELLGTMTRQELRDLADRNVWPERLRGVAETLGLNGPGADPIEIEAEER